MAFSGTDLWCFGGLTISPPPEINAVAWNAKTGSRAFVWCSKAVVVLRNRSMLPSQCRTLDELSSQLSKGLVRAISLSVGSGWRVAAFSILYPVVLLKRLAKITTVRGITFRSNARILGLLPVLPVRLLRLARETWRRARAGSPCLTRAFLLSQFLIGVCFGNATREPLRGDLLQSSPTSAWRRIHRGWLVRISV